MDTETAGTPTLPYVAEIVTAYLAKNSLTAHELVNLIREVHAALSGLSQGSAHEPPPLKPAVPVKKSVTPGYIVCLEDGQKLKMLKRYLRARYNLSPEAYRARWNLPHDYPIVAPNYAALRSTLAKKSGLGKRSRKALTKGKSRF